MIFRTILLFLALSVGGGFASADEFYTIRGVEIAETGADLVIAKDTGVAKAKRDALHSLLERMTNVHHALKLPQSSEIEAMVVQSEIRDETYGGDRYRALLDVVFQPRGVQNYLSRLGLDYLESRALPVQIIPQTRVMGVDIPTHKGNPAHDIWAELLAGESDAFHFVPLVVAEADFRQGDETFYTGNYPLQVAFSTPLENLDQQASILVRLTLTSLEDAEFLHKTRLEIQRDALGDLDWQPMVDWTQRLLDAYWHEQMLTQLGDRSVQTTLAMVIYSSDHAHIVALLDDLAKVQAINSIKHESITPRRRIFALSYRGSEAQFQREIAVLGLALKPAPLIKADNGTQYTMLERQ